MRARSVAPLALVGVAGCLFDGAVPEGAALTCADAADCPATHRCVAAVCLAPGEALPSLAPLTLTTDEDTELTIRPVAHDAAAPRFVLAEPPAHGRVTCADGAEACRDCAPPPSSCELAATGARYRPDDDWSGTDVLSVLVEDTARGARRGAPGAVTIEVRPVNDPPEAVAALALTLDEDGADALPLGALVQDADGDQLEFTITGAPTLGAASEDDELLVYTGLPDRWGTDLITLSASDGVATIEVDVPVTIASVNDPPHGTTIDIVVTEDAEAVDVTAAVLADAVDVDGDELRLAADPERPATHGAVTVEGGVRYQPAPDYFGPDAFGALILDESDGATAVVVRVLVEPADDAPRARAVDLTTDEDQPAIVVFDGENPDGPGGEFRVTSSPSHGTLTGLDAKRGVALYIPDDDYFGEDAFTFRLADTDTGEESELGAVAIHVLGVPDAPRVLTTSVLVPSALPSVDLDVAIVDPDGDTALDVGVIRQPAHGRIAVAEDGTGLLTFVRDGNAAFLADSFTLQVKDGLLSSGETTIAIVSTSRESCAHILNAGESTGDAVYVIDPGDGGGDDTFLAYCDMSTAGGGWTLALRIDGRSNTFAYEANTWTSSAVLNPDAPDLLDVVESKLASYHAVALTELLVGFSPFTVDNGMEQPTGDFRYVRARLAASDTAPLPSLEHAILNTTLDLAAVPIGATEGTRERERWLSAVPGMSLQDKSDRARLNNYLAPADHAARIGILGSDLTTLTTSQSYIGVGSNKSPSSGQRRARGPCTGSMDCNTSIGEQCIESLCVESLPALAAVLVRGRDFMSLGSRTSCEKHGEAGAVVGGVFLVNDEAKECQFGPTEAICGDRFVDPEEECDDDNIKSGDGCDRHCRMEQCGNGRVEDNEECDDANATNGDGCDVNCTSTRCGNGVVTGSEECDNAPVSGDGCDALCRVEVCGNGRVELNEQCDDGNTQNGDGCESNCRRPIGGTCFVAGTSIATPMGPRAIEELAEGDHVWASASDDAKPATVARTWRRAADHLRILRVDGVEVRTTDEHPFFVLGRGFTRAAELRAGDALVTLRGHAARVDASERLDGSYVVFNLEVAGPHTYFVSPLSLLVHNKGGDPGSDPDPGPGGAAN